MTISKVRLSSAETQEAVRVWLGAHPLPPALVEGMKQFFLDLRTPDGQRIAALLGERGSVIPVAQRPAPEGSAKASPMARFTLDVPKKNK